MRSSWINSTRSPTCPSDQKHLPSSPSCWYPILAKACLSVGKHRGGEYGVRAPGRLLRSEPGKLGLGRQLAMPHVGQLPGVLSAASAGTRQVVRSPPYWRAHGADCALSQETAQGRYWAFMPRLGPILSAMRAMEPNDSGSPFLWRGGHPSGACVTSMVFHLAPHWQPQVQAFHLHYLDVSSANFPFWDIRDIHSSRLGPWSPVSAPMFPVFSRLEDAAAHPRNSTSTTTV